MFQCLGTKAKDAKNKYLNKFTVPVSLIMYEYIVLIFYVYKLVAICNYIVY